ncbi:AbrB family transcriptional regulator [Levilactobacillus namurensis]|uniref:AbrB family transcriptional regulator n=1 Tax=Levilactobacillus namurensis TaxID=380393 RepID=UPI0026EA4A30|nr:AbrB family transcriptional regulator [Levilactobacillus namurensis]
MAKTNATNVRLFKNGKLCAFRISKKDREALEATSKTKFKKKVSDDGHEIIFRKIEPNQADLMTVSNRLLDKHGDLLKRLEDL